MMARRKITRVTIRVAARRAGVSPGTVRRYIRRGLVDEALTEADLARLRRIRRLTRLGINLAGVEVILRMRRRIERLQAQVRSRLRRPETPETWMLVSPHEWDEAD